MQQPIFIGRHGVRGIVSRRGPALVRKGNRRRKDKTFKGDRRRSVPSVKIMAERDKTHVLEEAARGPGNF